jgi:hypothetical protein
MHVRQYIILVIFGANVDTDASLGVGSRCLVTIMQEKIVI